MELATYDLIRFGDNVIDIKKVDEGSPTGTIYERWVRRFSEKERDIERIAQQFTDFNLSMNDVDNAVHVGPDAEIQTSSKKRFRKATVDEQKSAFFYPLDLENPDDAFEVSRYTHSLLWSSYLKSEYNWTPNIRHCEAAFQACKKWFENGKIADSGKLAKTLLSTMIELSSDSPMDYLAKLDQAIAPLGLSGQLEFQDAQVTEERAKDFISVVEKLMAPHVENQLLS